VLIVAHKPPEVDGGTAAGHRINAVVGKVAVAPKRIWCVGGGG
jgi:hypothetical protein